MNLFRRLASPAEENDELIGIRKRIAQIISVVASIVGTLAYFSAVFTFVQNRQWIMFGIQTGAFVLVSLMAVLRGLSYRLRVTVILVILYLMGTSTLFESGLAGEGRLYLTIFALMAFVLLEARQALAVFILSAVTVFAVGLAMSQGYLATPAPGAIYDSSKLPEWVTGTLVYAMLAGLVIASLYALIDGLQKALHNQRRLSQELQEERGQMEQRIEERTRELQQRAFQLETVSQYSQEISHLNDLDEIIRCTLSTFQDRLQFTSLAIFLVNPDETHYGYQDGAGRAAETLQVARFPVGQAGQLSQLIERGEPILLNNAASDSHLFNELGLPGTKMLFLLPFRETSRSLGAVLLLPDEERPVDLEDLPMYRGLTDRLGSALEKGRLLAVLRKNVEKLKRSNQQVTQHAWRSYLRAGRQKLAYRCAGEKIEMVTGEPDEAAQALRESRVVVAPVGGSEDQPVTAVAAPILLRDQPLGVIDIRFNSPAVPDDLIDLIVATTRRLSLALENIRLMDEVKQRAEREHLVSDISSKVRASSDIDGILKATALEIGRSLGVSEVFVQLSPEQ